MRTRQALAALLATSALVLGACGSDSDSDSETPVVTSDMGVEIAGEVGEKPTLTIPDEKPPSELEVEVLSEGDGPEVAATDVVVADYLGQTWKPRAPQPSASAPAPEPQPSGEPEEGAAGGADPSAGSGESGAPDPSGSADPDASVEASASPTGDPEPYVFDNSYDRGQAAGFSLDAVIPGWKEALAGQKVGSRVLMSIPPEQGYGSAQGHDLQNDTLVFVVDIVDSVDATAGASGEPVQDLPEGMPSVESTDGAAPKVQLSGATPPEKSDSTVVITGDGEELKENLVVNMVQTSYPDGKDPISTWDEGQTPIVLAPQQLAGIPGLAEALKGQTVGSRVVTRIAAADNPQGQSGGTPLVLVIDIIGTF